MKNKIRKVFSGREVTFITDYDNMSNNERETFFKAYDYNRSDDSYYLVDREEAETIKDKLNVDGD